MSILFAVVLLLVLGFSVFYLHPGYFTRQKPIIPQLPRPEQSTPILKSKQTPSPSSVKRMDPPKEAAIQDIRRLLQQARRIAIFCGEDVDIQTSKFFANSLQTDLGDQSVEVSLHYQEETLVKSFFVPPIAFPFTDVTLRLIEDGPPDKTQLYIGSFCFDQYHYDGSGFQLPRWVQLEQGTEAGPLEKDRADAARLLAREFSGFWRVTVQ